YALVHAAGFVKQARIPFFIFQLRIMLSAVVMFFFALIGVFLFAVASGQPPAFGSNLLLIPAYVVVAVLFCVPITIIMSIVGALFRDVGHISVLIERAIFLLSPVMLPREILDQPQLKFLEFVNPIVPFLDMFRDPVMYGKLWDPQDVVVMSIWIVGLWGIALTTAISSGRRVVFAI
ncbi:MAG: ABC transporter permease, partial [Hyphomonadaceae bacterium]